MSHPRPRFSVVIVNYNSGDRLGRCLRRLAAQTLAPHQIIVIDNASTDDSVAQARNTDIDFELIPSETNLGFAAGNNRAVSFATGEWVAFLNPDAYAEPSWLEAVAKGVENYPWADAFGSLQLDAIDERRLDGAGDAYFFAGVPYRGNYGWAAETAPGEGECFAPCAAAAIYRRDVFNRLGGFEERFFCYGEDVDLGFRLRLAGGRSVQLENAVVRHEGSAITGRRSYFTMYHGHRNRILTYYRNMPLMLLVASLPFHLFANVYLACRFAVTGDLKPYLHGLKDGLVGLREERPARKRIQAERRARLRDIARVLTWSPIKVYRRQADLRQLPKREGPERADEHARARLSAALDNTGTACPRTSHEAPGLKDSPPRLTPDPQ